MYPITECVFNALYYYLSFNTVKKYYCLSMYNLLKN